MFLKINQTLFIFTLIMGTMMAISSNSWFTAWLGLEINLLSMIPLMLNKLNPSFTDSAIKYFLSQALASLILIFSVTLNFHNSAFSKIFSMENMILIALAIKAGIPPLHLWFPQVIKTMNWIQCLILFTWQKIAPLILFSLLSLNKIVPVAMIAITTGATAGINQTMIKPLLAYSAITHSSWIMIACLAGAWAWLIYFIIYSSLSTCIISFLKKSSSMFLSDLSFWGESKTNKNMFIFNILSLAGLPPFLGFIAKINILIFMVSYGMTYAAVTFILASLISLYFYFRLSYAISMNSSETKKMTLIFNNPPLNLALITGTSLNILIPIMSPMI